MKETTTKSTNLSRLLKLINVSECDEPPVCTVDCELVGKRDEDDDNDLFTRSAVPTDTLACLHLCQFHTTTTPQPFYGPFSGTIRVSRCQKRTSGLYGARED